MVNRAREQRELADTDINDLFDVTINALSKPDLPDIVTFAESPEYLGKRLYPRQKTFLRLVYLDTENMTAYDIKVIDEWANSFYKDEAERVGVSPDIWERIDWLKENGYTHFREIVNITGRRGSKGHLGAIMAAYQIWQLIKLDDPQWYYGVERGKELYLYIAATTMQQAKQYQFADFANAVLDAECFRPYISSAKESYVHFRTPADIRRIAEMSAHGMELDREMASLRVHAISSNSQASRGGAGFAVIYDEFAHMLVGTEGPRTADKLYDAITPSTDQMGIDALIYIPTSPYTKVGRAYSIYQEGLARNEDGTPTNPDILVVQLPSWGLYEDWDNLEATDGRVFRGAPQLYDAAAMRMEARDPDTFKVERRAQWSEVVNAYLNSKMVDRIFEPFKDGNGNERILTRQDSGILRWAYRGHGDPSKSNANFAAAIGHVEKIPDEDGEMWDHVIIDWMNVWKPENYEDHQVDYIQIERELVNRILAFPTMKVFSYDQYGAFVTLPKLRQELSRTKSKTKIEEVTFSAQSNKRRAEVFKSSLGMGWVHSYLDDFGPEEASLLSLELKFLQDRNGVIDRQKIGPVTTKDLADCAMVICDELLRDQLQRLKKREELGNTRLSVGNTQFGAMHREGQEVSDARSRLMKNSRSRVGSGKNPWGSIR